MNKKWLLTIVLVLVLAAAVLALTGCCGLFQREPTATPTPPPEPTVPAEATVPPVAEDDSWERIQAAGKIVVGTSADYPPFEFMSGDFKIDGFDVALMDEIGRRLGVQIDYRNFAFDGLGSALIQGQIDVAIAAISVTPDREAEVDFSNVYFVGEDGVIARSDSSIGDIAVPADMAPYKVGVQRSTVYESWLQETLVDTGEMPSSNLFAYEAATDAVRDLDQQRLDLVVLDAQPAEEAVLTGDFKLVGGGMNQQRYAIALPKGATALKEQLDQVLTTLNNEGFIAQLARDYLDLDPEDIKPLPTPTPKPAQPAPTSTPGPQPSCRDGLALVQHLNYDHQGMSAPPEFPPGQPLTKSWRVKNTGTCTWDTNYRFEFAHGNVPAAKMGGRPTNVTRAVAPGETYDVDIDLVAPLSPGTYQAFWQIHNAGGQAFGERLSVGARVVAGPTPTPVPTEPPSPGVTFTADRTQIKHGECVVFYWKVTDVQAVYFYAEGEKWQDNGVTGEEGRKECPPVTLTYYLRVVHQDNSVEVPQITIYVDASTNAPYIKRFTVDPPDQITLGQCLNIRWNVEGAVNLVRITANDTVLWDGAPTSGSYQHCPDRTGLIGYGIEAAGPGGTSRAQQNVNVVEEAAATPVPTPGPEQPIIYSFSVTPNQIGVGECVDVNWSVGGGANYVRILRNDQVVLDDAGFNGNGQDCLGQAGDYTYRLEAYNPAGQPASEQQRVSVSEGATDNPLAKTRWQATNYWDGSAMAPVIPGSEPRANFKADGSLNGYAGCNEYSGEYYVSGNSLSISGISKSGKSCNEERTAQEKAFLGALQSATAFNLEAGQLYILDGSGTATIEFAAR